MKRILLSQLFIGLLIISFACDKAPENQSAAVSSNSNQATSTSIDQPEIEAKVTLVKYSDYQCPACKYFVPFEHQLKEDYGDDIKIIVKNFPLSMHPYAHVAARSSEAARKQGMYQEMHDMIFEGQEQWSSGNAEAIFIGYARALGMNVEQFQQDMNSADMNRIVMSDRREGLELGVGSTPTFFINGEKMESNPSTYSAFKAVIEEYLK